MRIDKIIQLVKNDATKEQLLKELEELKEELSE